MANKDGDKSPKLSQAEQKIAKKMINADITKDIPLKPGEWEAFCELMGQDGVILQSSENGEVKASQK